MSSWFQPLVQSKKRIAWNLILAAIAGTAILLLLHLVFNIPLRSINSELSAHLGFSFMILVVAVIFYLAVIFPFLLIYFCLLQHFHKFSIFSILIAGFMATVLIVLFSGSTDQFFKAFKNLCVFSIPAAAFFLFFSLRSHRINTENLPI